MDIKILESKNNRIVFEISGETHAFANLLKSELYKDKAVKIATYRIGHPLIGIPRFIVETTGKKSPKSILKSAALRAAADIKKLASATLKAIK